MACKLFKTDNRDSNPLGAYDTQLGAIAHATFMHGCENLFPTSVCLGRLAIAF